LSAPTTTTVGFAMVDPSLAPKPQQNSMGPALG
jgi:hypothetical protein